MAENYAHRRGAFRANTVGLESLRVRKLLELALRLLGIRWMCRICIVGLWISSDGCDPDPCDPGWNLLRHRHILTSPVSPEEQKG